MSSTKSAESHSETSIRIAWRSSTRSERFNLPEAMAAMRLRSGLNGSLFSMMGDILTRGGVAYGWGGFELRKSGGEDSLGPEAALARVEPENWGTQVVERRRGEKLVEQIVDALLEGAIFGAETVGGNFECDGRDSDEK